MNKIIKTNDQSHSILSERFSVTYHSKFGAIQESLHIFIHAGLEKVLHTNGPIRILEVGLGTGLDVLLSQIFGNKRKVDIHYTALELYPLDVAITDQLNYPKLLNTSQRIFKQIHQCDWGVDLQLTDNFTFKKIQTDLVSWQPDEMYDVIFFDAFSPDIQPELWTEAIFQKLYNSTLPDGVLVTYSVKGIVKRALKAAGYLVEKLPGPPGKREMTRGIKDVV